SEFIVPAPKRWIDLQTIFTELKLDKNDEETDYNEPSLNLLDEETRTCLYFHQRRAGGARKRTPGRGLKSEATAGKGSSSALLLLFSPENSIRRKTPSF